MPSLVHASSRLTGSPGVALVSHSVSEQANGLYSVSCEFVCRASSSVAVDNLFYPDAEPPVYPSAVNKQYLLSGRLFMSDREVKTENGLSYISASYASGITRNGSFGYISTERESIVYRLYPIAFDLEGNLRAWITFAYVPIVITHEYVQVNNEKSAVFVPPQPDDLYALIEFSGVGVFGTTVEKYARSLIRQLARTEDTARTNVTPSVIVKQTRYYIADTN
jgi:hypothetical protein